MLEKNQTLQGRYQIIRPLGHGGMGTVYEAKDTKLFGKLVALKEILLDKTLSPSQKDYKTIRRAFEREAKILTQLQHEAFPQVIDYFVENDRQFLVMELIQGKDLSELLKKRKSPFEVEDVLKWANQLLDALDYLHWLTPPTIHRDIKPQNLKLNSRKRIKLLDFGIAKGIDLPANITLTNQTFVGATFNYSPFEQIFRVLDSSFIDALKPFYSKQLEEVAGQTADASSDIYALGATLYHLLTKQLPFDSLKRTLEIWAGNDDPLPSPQTINPNIPTELSDWVLKAMEVDRRKRFDSAIAMKNALRVVVEGDKIREESTRKLRLKREKEILQMEREALETERRKFEVERKRYKNLTPEPLENAETVSDFPVIREDGETDYYKTNTSFPADLPNHPSVLTLGAEKLSDESQPAETSNDFTATSYLVNLNLEPDESEVKEKQAEVTATAYMVNFNLEADKKPKAKQKGTPKLPVVPQIKRNSVWLVPLAISFLFLCSITVFGILLLRSGSVNKEPSTPVTESAITEPIETPVSAESTPEIVPEIVVETVKKNHSETKKEVKTISTPKPFTQIKVKPSSEPEASPQQSSASTPTPQRVKTPTPKPTKTPKPKGNPDCIFNNDCR